MWLLICSQNMHDQIFALQLDFFFLYIVLVKGISTIEATEAAASVIFANGLVMNS